MTFNNTELQEIWNTIVQNTAILVGGNLLDNPNPNIKEVYNYLINYLNETDGLVREKEPEEVKDYLTGIAVCARYLKNGYVCEKETAYIAPYDAGYPLRYGEEYVLDIDITEGTFDYYSSKVILTVIQEGYNWRWAFLNYENKQEEVYVNLDIREGKLIHSGTDVQVCWQLTKNSNSLAEIAEMLDLNNILNYRPGYTCSLSSEGVLTLEGSASESAWDLFEITDSQITLIAYDTPTYWFSEFNLSQHMTKDSYYFAIGEWMLDGLTYQYVTPVIKFNPELKEPRELKEAPSIFFDPGSESIMVTNYTDPYWNGLSVSIERENPFYRDYFKLQNGTILNVPYFDIKNTPGTYKFQLHDLEFVNETHSPITTITITTD